MKKKEVGSHEERRHPSRQKNNQVQMDHQAQAKRSISGKIGGLWLQSDPWS
jgi:hypothetical protein